jgi:tetratricopeptide (TPR) repeat protein
VQAEQYYQQALALRVEFGDRYSQAGTYHQLGRVAQEQLQWVQAEQYYQQALALWVEFGDRYSQASTYHQLGRVAQSQQQWAQARDYLLKALSIFQEFADEHSLGITLHSLACLRAASGDATLAAAVAQALRVSEEEAERQLQILSPNTTPPPAWSP